ncbi:MAG: TolC family protein [Alphaproteobacteria bacterium]|nr:TolC family protein [Alphaproteobacteria bacterium]
MHKILLLSVSFIITSCTVGPNYVEPKIYEDKQISQSLRLNNTDLKISNKWYEQFGDEKLNTLINYALLNSPDIISSISKLRQARTLVLINKTNFLPMLNLNSQYNYEKPSKNIGLVADTDYFQIGFDASWELDIWGKGRRLDEQTMAEFEEALYSLRNIKSMITAEVATTFFNLKTVHENLNIAYENIKLQQDIFNMVSEKYKAGLTDSATYHQAKYILDTTKALIPTLENDEANLKNALAVLCGTLPDRLPVILSKTDTNPLTRAYKYDLKVLYNLPASIIRTRPDVKVAERTLAAQNAKIGQAIAEMYPNVSVGALLGMQSENVSDLFNSDSKAYSYAPNLSLPLFNWNKLSNNVTLQKQIKQETYQNYRKTLLQAVEELNNATVSIEKELKRNAAERNAVYSMQKVLKSMQEKYENGLIEFSDLLQTQQNLLKSQTDLANSSGNIFKNIVAYYKATGGGY